MAYVYKNGMRFFVSAESEKPKEDGYHYHNDISVKIGTGLPRTLRLHVHDRHGAGIFIPFKVKMERVNCVKLNNQKLQHKIDFIIKDNEEIAFTFNLISSDKIEIEGIV